MCLHGLRTDDSVWSILKLWTQLLKKVNYVMLITHILFYQIKENIEKYRRLSFFVQKRKKLKKH